MPLDQEPLSLQAYSGSTSGLFAALERVAASSSPAPLAVPVGRLESLAPALRIAGFTRLGLAVRQSHFATCPNADEHRRR